jgi:hypothetical protein
MRDVPLEAKVECADGPCGESGIVILNPDTWEVTHFVVQDKALPDHDQHLVPIDQVVHASRKRIQIRCTRDELAAMHHFVDSHYAHTEKEPRIDWPVDYTTHAVPRATLDEPRYAKETVEHVPPGELTVRRGARVAAKDGHIWILSG